MPSARRRQGVFRGLFRIRRGAKAEAEDGRHPFSRRRIRQDLGRRRARKRQGKGFNIIYDKSYPPPTTDFAPTVRAIQAAESRRGVHRRLSARHRRHRPRGEGDRAEAKNVRRHHDRLLITPIKTQLGPILDGIVIMESFVPMLNFPGHADLLKAYRRKPPARKSIRSATLRAVRLCRRPGAGAGGRGRRQPRSAKLADYMHSHTFHTVVGESPTTSPANGPRAHVVHAVPERRAGQHGPVRATAAYSRCYGRRNTRPAP